MTQYLIENYKGKKVFLTGHTGFKGSWFLACLQYLQANVKGYALATENENDHFNLIEGNKISQSVIGNICDAQKLEQEIVDFQPDFLFHFAAQPLVRLSYEQPIETYQTNVIGTLNVLNSVRKLQKKCSIVIITTDKVYENREWIYPYRETDELGGYDPYSSSKACAEIATKSFKNSFFNLKDYSTHQKAIATARAGNVIGGGDWAKDRIIPDIIRAVSENKAVEIRNPKAVRPWQHVLDPLAGYLLLGAKLHNNPQKYSSAWNFGPTDATSFTVEDLAIRTIEIYGSGTYIANKQEAQLHEANLLQLDISKALIELKWTPKFNEAQAIEQTIEWYKSYLKNQQLITQKQVNHYFDA